MVKNNNNINSKPRERLFLLDGNALAYRAYYTFISRPLITSKGEHTSAVYGFVNALMKILEEEKPEHIAVVFDRPEPTFRHKIYEAYKATRQKMPEDMASQIARLREVVKAFNVPILEMAGYEADDIMGTLTRRAEKENIETYLVTSDKDFMQLISPLTKIFRPGKSGNEWEIIDFEHVEEKFGVTPDKVVEVLALTGDKSDNVPGVPGIGEMTAIPLVREYGTIENILENIDKISKPALQQKLRDNKDKALLSKTLVTINTNVPIDVDIHKLKAQQINIAKLTQLFTELEFKNLIRKLSSVKSETLQTLPTEDKIAKAITDITTDQHQYHIIKTDQELADLIEKLKASKFFVFDTETTSTNPSEAELIGLAFSLKPREAYYIPIKSNNSEKDKSISNDTVFQKSLFDDHSTTNSISQLEQHFDLKDDIHSGSQTRMNSDSYFSGFDCSKILNLLSPIFSDKSISKCGQNIKYDLIVLKQHGLETAGTFFDTMIANYILRPDGRHNLDSMALEHLNYKTISFEEIIGKETDLRRIPIERIAEYSAEDADITFRLYEILDKKLRADNLIKISNDIEFPLIEVLTEMEFAGVKIDTLFLKSLSKKLEGILDNTIEDIYQLAGKKFNINSTQQLGIILFEDLKLPTGRKTKTGFSTDVGVLESLKHQHPIVDKLLEYRTISKIKSTYVDALPVLINRKSGRLHTSFNQTITTTGRLSSSNPNLQNIPIRSELGREIRKAFIPQDDEWAILSADYSQIELRIMAHISKDPGLIEAFKGREDIHASTAAKIFGYEINDFKSLPKETKQEMRRKAKEVNFGIMYGLGYFGLASRLDISKEEAREIISKYHERFPNVKLYMEETINKTKRDGYVETLMGRRRYLPEIKSRNQNIRSNAERQAINMPIQGTAADMIKLAMIRIHRRISNQQIRMLLQVHDELVFEVKNSYVETAKILIVEEMKNALPLDVPLEIEVGYGKNWFEAH